MSIVDLSHPANPTILGEYTPARPIEALDVAGDYAYVGASGYGLEVVDVADPASPAHVATCMFNSRADEVRVFGTRAYVRSMWQGLWVVDVSDPTSPVLSGKYPWSYHFGAPPTLPAPGVPAPAAAGSLRGICAAGDLVYVADLFGLLILDASDPSSPTPVCLYWRPAFIRGIDLDGNLAYLASSRPDLTVLDVSDPSSPTLLATRDSDDTALDVLCSEGRAFLALQNRGLQVLDIRNPARPSLRGSFPIPGSPGVLAADGDTVSISAGWSGLWILRAASGYPACAARWTSYR
jgi:hypothetical protein